MNSQEELDKLREELQKGLDIAHKKMVEYKISKNSPIIISENGEILEIDPHDMVAEPSEGESNYKTKKD